MVTWILSDNQKQRRLDVSRQFTERNTFLDRVITGDESWCCQYDLETEHQSMQWKTSTPPRPNKGRIEVKKMLFCSLNAGIVHFEFIEQYQTANEHCYLKYWQDYVRQFSGEDIGLVLGSCIRRTRCPGVFGQKRDITWTIRHIRQIWPRSTIGCSETKGRFKRSQI